MNQLVLVSALVLVPPLALVLVPPLPPIQIRVFINTRINTINTRRIPRIMIIRVFLFLAQMYF
jgi:hypothetical protein